MDPDSEHILDEQIRAGLGSDEQARLSALRRAMDYYTYRLGGIAKKYLGNSDPHDVVEAVDRTFQALWERHQSINGYLWPWLAGVVAHQAISLMRQRIRRQERSMVSLQSQTSENGLSLEESGELMLIAQAIEDPWSGIILEEYIENFASCVHQLPPKQRIVGSIMLDAVKSSGELPDNEDILKQVRRMTGDLNFSMQAVKSAKKQVLSKLRPKITRREKQEQRAATS